MTNNKIWVCSSRRKKKEELYQFFIDKKHGLIQYRSTSVNLVPHYNILVNIVDANEHYPHGPR